MDTKKRSIVKTFTFRIIATMTTMILIVIFTGNFLLAGTIGFLELISKLMIYYFHERAWDRISWGIKSV